MFLGWLDGLVCHVAVGRRVVGVRTVVAIDGHDTVALIGVESAEGLVDRDLLVVDAEAVAVGIWVGEEAGLQDGVGGGLDTGDHVAWGEGDLFDFSKVVLCVLVESEFAKGS